MPQFAGYFVIEDDVVRLQSPPTSPGQLPIEYQSDEFALPDVRRDAPAILTVQVNPSSNADIRLRVVLNDVAVVPSKVFDTDPERLWHEPISGSALQASGNKLEVLIQQGSTGTIRLSDIVLWFRADRS